jgi:hypothetical protein
LRQSARRWPTDSDVPIHANPILLQPSMPGILTIHAPSRFFTPRTDPPEPPPDLVLRHFFQGVYHTPRGTAGGGVRHGGRIQPSTTWVTHQLVGRDGNSVGTPPVWALAGHPGLGCAERCDLSVCPGLSNVSGANEIGEPNGEPTPADARPRQATASHGFRS